MWTAIAVGVTALGVGLQASAQRKAAKAEERAGESRQRSANIEAAHMDQQAGLSIASAQRQMLEERRQARLLESRALAVAAASGAGASDNTVVNIISRIAAEGAYRESLALYEGQERSRQLRVGADIRREGGDLQAEYGRAAAKAHEIASIGTLFSGATSLYAKYGGMQRQSKPSSGLSGGAGLLDE